MSAPLFLACSLGVVAVSVTWLGYYIRHANDELSIPDVHGDYPAVPDEVIEKAIVEARIRDLAQFHASLPESRS